MKNTGSKLRHRVTALAIGSVACALVVAFTPTASATTCTGTLEQYCFDDAHISGSGQSVYLTDGALNLTSQPVTMECKDTSQAQILPSVPGVSVSGRDAAQAEIWQALGLDAQTLQSTARTGMSTTVTVHAAAGKQTVCARGAETKEFSLHTYTNVRRLSLSVSGGLGWRTVATTDGGTVDGWVPTGRRWFVTEEPLT